MPKQPDVICPFCGWSWFFFVFDKKHVMTVCRSCFAYGPEVYTGHDHLSVSQGEETKAHQLWNKRASKLAQAKGGFSGCPWCGSKKHVCLLNYKYWSVAICTFCHVGGPPVNRPAGDSHSIYIKKERLNHGTKEWLKNE